MTLTIIWIQLKKFSNPEGRKYPEWNLEKKEWKTKTDITDVRHNQCCLIQEICITKGKARDRNIVRGIKNANIE